MTKHTPTLNVHYGSETTIKIQGSELKFKYLLAADEFETPIALIPIHEATAVEENKMIESLIKAVNSYEELVETLKLSLTVLVSVMEFSTDDDLIDLHGKAFYALKKSREALVKAEGN